MISTHTSFSLWGLHSRPPPLVIYNSFQNWETNPFRIMIMSENTWDLTSRAQNIISEPVPRQPRNMNHRWQAVFNWIIINMEGPLKRCIDAVFAICFLLHIGKRILKNLSTPDYRETSEKRFTSTLRFFESMFDLLTHHPWWSHDLGVGGTRTPLILWVPHAFRVNVLFIYSYLVGKTSTRHLSIRNQKPYGYDKNEMVSMVWR